jgi:hypothetical protein
LEKLTKFHIQHATPMRDVLSGLQAAAEQISRRQYAAEAVALAAAVNRTSSRQRSGPCRFGELLPEILAKPQVPTVELPLKGKTDLT